MRAYVPLLLVGLLTACAGHRTDDDDATAEIPLDDEAKTAQASIADIEKKVERGDLMKINFEFDKDELTKESLPTLERIAEILLKSERLKLFILAHTDNIGTEAYNLDLSERRAKSVKTFLVQKGLPPPTIRFHGYGFSKPIADNSTEEGRAKNRRVEFRVTTREWSSIY